MIKTIASRSKNRFVLAIALALTLSIGVVQAFAAQSWLYMTPSDETVVGDLEFVPAGTRIYYEWQNNGSIHGVGVGVYYFDGQSSTLMSNKTAAYGDGGTFGSFQAPYNGYYFLRAKCGGNGQTGCKGSGFME
ncbi:MULTISPECIES: hypothetical protein [Brevibacillus]|nr:MULTISPECIES: hypothetical protein [Brevibacillus]MCM3082149.1 hypothetical protein [Brevibacillus invocatus]MCM3432577.1 hypothetical protein [Brevibacillus invocatus]MDH4618943.1 hypothetical protein [Brevibacillus sp. AY1]